MGGKGEAGGESARTDHDDWFKDVDRLKKKEEKKTEGEVNGYGKSEGNTRVGKGKM